MIRLPDEHTCNGIDIPVIRGDAQGSLLIDYAAQDRRPSGVLEIDTMGASGHNSNPGPLGGRTSPYEAGADIPRTKLIGANMVWCWTSVYARDINVGVGGDRRQIQ